MSTDLLQADPNIGTVLSHRYKIESVLGSGGMGVVYQARHLLLDKLVAIKILRLNLGDNEADRIRRFNQEGRLIGSLKHPNIVSALDLSVDQGRLFLVMELITGKTLSQEIDSFRGLSWQHGISIFIQLADALGYAHSKGIVHRDIKPGNVMLTHVQDPLTGTSSEVAKILDFGVAKILTPLATPAKPVTRTGIVFGSPPYMAPEQCLGQPADPRSDIYSLGCVMYETLSGELPIDGENSLEILHKQVMATPRPVSKLNAPVGLQKIIEHALVKDINQRYQSMSDLKYDLQQFQQDPEYIPGFPEPEPTPPAATASPGEPVPVRPRFKISAPLVAAVSVPLLVVLYTAMYHPKFPVRTGTPRLAVIHNDDVALSAAVTRLKKILPPTDPALREIEHVQKDLSD